MSSVDGGDRADLTARAKIRNAAVAHFAREGFQRPNLRAIAATAEVSAGLVIHHFGSKQGLRRACDEYVLGVLVRRARDARPGTSPDLLREFMSSPETYALHVRYMVRAVEEDSAAGNTFVTTLVEETETIFRAGIADGSIRPCADPRALAVLNVVLSLAMLTMAPPLTRALGHEAFGAEVLHRMAVPTLELFTHGLYTDGTLLKDAEAARNATENAREQERTERNV
ncbi:TetR/AcrR family transcriptional regulator [Saccharopolyspora shandongensis]|uniref:TetR/AcrR family transcriptional regulator n=1 Tax=Saccharopolyspora shandongensis TaxID=418495 RepID=UPI0033C11575